MSTPKIVRKTHIDSGGSTAFWLDDDAMLMGWHEPGHVSAEVAAQQEYGWPVDKEDAAEHGTTLAEIRRELEAQ